MRKALFLILFSAFFTMCALAQDPVAAAKSACGPNNVSFDVQDDNSSHAVKQPEPGKALIYVIQDIGVENCLWACMTTKIAMDGAWLGANRHNSYFVSAVDPGERHLCVNWQSHIERFSKAVGLVHFTAEAGQVYFFRTRIMGINGPAFFDFEPIDSDQGKLFVAQLPMSVSHPKK